MLNQLLSGSRRSWFPPVNHTASASRTRMYMMLEYVQCQARLHCWAGWQTWDRSWATRPSTILTTCRACAWTNIFAFLALISNGDSER
jgi:hypothetical protein